MVRNPNDWTFKDDLVADLIEQGIVNLKQLEGFVYLITNLTNNRKYVGKKSFWTRRKNKKTNRKVTAESDWNDYYGSSDDLKTDVVLLGKDNFKREMLYICFYKTGMTYYEMKEQFVRDVLMTDEYYNTNIGGKFFVSKSNKVYESYNVTTKNDRWKEIKSECMTGEGNTAKRLDVRKKISESKTGDNHHRFGKNNTSNHQKAIRDAVTGTRNMYHGPVNIKVRLADIERYTSMGWVLGQNQKAVGRPNKIYITDGLNKKQVYDYPPLLEIYTKDGWQRGTVFKKSS